MKKILILFSLSLCVLVLTVACNFSSKEREVTDDVDRVLNIYNWENYIHPEVITNFEKDFQVKIGYTTFGSIGEMYANLEQKKLQYDLVFPGNYNIERAINNNLLSPIDLDLIPNTKNLISEYLNITGNSTKNTYSLPYQWGTIGIGYNLQETQKIIDSWGYIFDGNFKGRISLIDNMQLVFAIVLMHLGLEPDSTSPQDIDRAKQYLIDRKDYFAFIYDYDGKTFLDDGKVDLALEYNGTIAELMSANGSIEYVIPKEGSIKWIDSMAIPKNSSHKKLAHEFINYILEPENAAKISNFTHYATPNKKALERNLISPTDRNNPAIYPSPKTLDRVVELKNIGTSIRLYELAWQEFKTEWKKSNDRTNLPQPE
jgi:spermidine/putrescine transport system substrate-binding protein